MNRTYNFQVDNGLFVAEHYLKKNYQDINVEDLKENVSIFAEKMFDYNKLGTLSSTSHQNSALTQPAFKNNRLEKITEQLNELLENISNHKVCAICGKKLVNVEYEINPAFMAMIPSTNNFTNRANNLHTIDVCPICLFLSYISFLNTQKISYPFLYLSDSDEFMREITDEIQIDVKKSILTERKIKGSDKYFLDVLQEIVFAKDLYDDMTYIDLVYFANAQNNYYSLQTIKKKKLLFIMKLKREQLLHEFCELNLFHPYIQNRLGVSYLIKSDTKEIYKLICSYELYRKLEGEFMTHKELEIVEYATEKLLKNNSVETILKDLKVRSTNSEFEKFILKYSEEELIYKSLIEYNELKNIYKYKNALIANLLLNR